jgi:DNA-binding NtrC family response regulator
MSVSGKNILIVDDDPEVRDLLKVEFEFEMANVFVVSSARMALEVLSENKIDGVVSDVRMPEMNGYQLLQKIREHNAQTPKVILVSGFSECTRKEVIDAGAIDLLSKPVDLPSLVKLMSDAL